MYMAIKAIIGLGNPGPQYEHTYHNVGAWSLSYLKELAEHSSISGIIFYRPKSFMNESGRDVALWLKRNNLAPSEIIIAHDDSDLAIGSYKLAVGGSSAGHNGVQSIIDRLGTEEFFRLRIGIRNPEEEVRKKALDFVLKRFPEKLEPIFQATLTKAWTEIQALLV